MISLLIVKFAQKRFDHFVQNFFQKSIAILCECGIIKSSRGEHKKGENKMYDFLIGLTFDEAVEELEAREIEFDFGECTIDEAREGVEIYIGGLYSDGHYVVETDDNGIITEVYEEENNWD